MSPLSDNYQVYDTNNDKPSNWVYKESRVSSAYMAMTKLIAQERQVISKQRDMPASLLILSSRIYSSFIYRLSVIQGCYFCQLSVVFKF